MNQKLMLVGVLLAGCSTAWDPDDFPGARVHAVAEPERLDMWQQAVEQVTTIWNTRLAEYGCQPAFVISDSSDAYPLRLVPAEDWVEHGVGACWSDRIDVKDVSYYANTLAHELGHAMGLGHHDDSYGPSIMSAPIVPIYDRDVRAAACVLGCGPCDTIHEYDVD